MKEYIDRQWIKLDEYISDIKSGKITVNRWIRLAVERYLSDLNNPDLEIRKDKVNIVFAFFSLVSINHKNKYQQFEPLPYQVFIAVNMLGFYWKGKDRRRFRYAFLFISRKSGKTVFASIMNLYFLIADGEQDPQSLLLASTREQASISLEYAKSIVMNSPALAKKVDLMQYQIRFDYKRSRGFMKTLASNSTRLDGYNPSGAILDEIHAYPDDSLFRVVKSGILARKNPMIMLISTAGFMVDSFCFDMVETMKNILKGDIHDESFFGMLFMLDEKDDYHDRSCWIKANPSLGTVIQMEAMEIEYQQAMNRPSELPNFLTKNLNVFTAATEAWLEDAVLKKRFKSLDPGQLERLRGCDMYLGLDLSSTKDLTSLVGLVQDPEDGRFYVFPYFFMANNPQKKIRSAGIDLSVWIQQGWIIECQTKTVDYDLIVSKIRELKSEFNVTMMAYDKFNSALIIPQVEEMGITCESFEQTAPKFNFPLKYLEKMVYDEQIIFVENKVLLWNFRNVVLYQDGNGNIKIMKNKSLDSVDGAVAAGMAIGIWINYNLSSEKIGLEAYNKY